MCLDQKIWMLQKYFRLHRMLCMSNSKKVQRFYEVNVQRFYEVNVQR
jgi:hypothetical protein